jgi:hypothetical protein
MKRVKRAKGGKSVYLTATIWEDTRGNVNMAVKEVPSFNVKVSPDASKTYGHPRLHRLLKKAITMAG